MEASSFRTVDGVELAIWTLAGDDVPEFLLVHGLASNARLWDGVARGLHARGHGVVSLDLRGHGMSAKPSDGFDFETMTADLAGLIATSMTAPIVAAGQSFGGNLVIELAARYPDLVSGVVCVDGGFVDLKSAWPDWDQALQVLTPPSLENLRGEALAGRGAEHYPGWPAEGVAAQLANLEVRADGTVRRRLSLENHLKILRAMWEQSPAEVATRVKVPVLILVAQNGPPRHPAQVDQFAAGLAKSRVIHMAGHHDLHAEQPDNVVDEITNALNDGFLQ